MAKERVRINTDGGSPLAADNPFASIAIDGLREVAPVKAAASASKPAPAPKKRRERLVLRKLKAGKGGKTVTEVAGFMAGATDVAALLKELQRQLGTGGTVKGTVMELQGECRDAVRPLLEARGYTVVGA